jgi:hypothetical protein
MQALSVPKLKVRKVVKEHTRVSYAAAKTSGRVNLYQWPTPDPIPEQVALTTQHIVLEEGEIENPKH